VRTVLLAELDFFPSVNFLSELERRSIELLIVDIFLQVHRTPPQSIYLSDSLERRANAEYSSGMKSIVLKVVYTRCHNSRY